MQKIKLHKSDNSAYHRLGHNVEHVEFLRPFFKSRHSGAKLFHRVKSANKHFSKGEKAVKHISLSFWCGGGGFLDRGRTYTNIPDGGVRCAVCEGKAIGAGVDGEKIINGERVSYSPRARASAND